MKQGIHPKYYPEAKVTCACGATWTTGSTLPELKTDVCGKCHPFYTGQLQRIVDSAGQVERFTKRVELSQELQTLEQKRAVAREERRKARQLVEIVEDEQVEPIEGLAEQPTEDAAEE